MISPRKNARIAGITQANPISNPGRLAFAISNNFVTKTDLLINSGLVFKKSKKAKIPVTPKLI